MPLPEEWGGVLGDDVLATAILDRLLHHRDVLSITGPSYRLKDRLNLVTGGENMPDHHAETDTSGRTRPDT